MVKADFPSVPSAASIDCSLKLSRLGELGPEGRVDLSGSMYCRVGFLVGGKKSEVSGNRGQGDSLLKSRE